MSRLRPPHGDERCPQDERSILLTSLQPFISGNDFRKYLCPTCRYLLYLLPSRAKNSLDPRRSGAVLMLRNKNLTQRRPSVSMEQDVLKSDQPNITDSTEVGVRQNRIEDKVRLLLLHELPCGLLCLCLTGAIHCPSSFWLADTLDNRHLSQSFWLVASQACLTTELTREAEPMPSQYLRHSKYLSRCETSYWA